ncbi:MAG: endonuclease NucS [Limnohabitans sp.]|nr:endonuclease NucS [Limnohabitans sp.]
MSVITIFDEQIEQLLNRINDSILSDVDKKEIEKVRENFIQTYSLGKIIGLTVEDYFKKYGNSEGCFEYDLENTTKILGDITGGLFNKFGEEYEFSKIKALFQKIIWLDKTKAYNADGDISTDLETVVLLTKDIDGMATDKTVIPKLLSIFFPDVFLPVFNQQELFLKKILKDQEFSEKTGLANYVENNFKLLKVKKQLEELAASKLDGYSFLKLLNDTNRTDLEILNQQHPTYVAFDEVEKETEVNSVESYFNNSQEEQEVPQEINKASSFLQDADDRQDDKKLFTTTLLKDSEIIEPFHLEKDFVKEESSSNDFQTQEKTHEEPVFEDESEDESDAEIDSEATKSSDNNKVSDLAPTYLDKYERVKEFTSVEEPIQNQINMEELEINRFLLNRNKDKFLPNLTYFDPQKQDAQLGQYDTNSVGVIDVLAVDKNGDFVVIEFKRDDNNECIGKILRFMGWTQNQLCKNGQSVRGIVISSGDDPDLQLLVKAVSNLKLMKLSVAISLIDC